MESLCFKQKLYFQFPSILLLSLEVVYALYIRMERSFMIMIYFFFSSIQLIFHLCLPVTQSIMKCHWGFACQSSDLIFNC